MALRDDVDREARHAWLDERERDPPSPAECFGFEPIYRPWRNGRKVGRTVYAMVGEQPSDDDVLIGVMDTTDLACEVVLAHNRAGDWL